MTSSLPPFHPNSVLSSAAEPPFHISVTPTPIEVQINPQRSGSETNEMTDTTQTNESITTTHMVNTSSNPNQPPPKSASVASCLADLLSPSSSDPEQSFVTSFLDSKYVKKLFADEVNKWRDLRQRHNTAKDAVSKLIAHERANTMPNSLKIKIDIKLPSHAGLESHQPIFSKILRDAEIALLAAVRAARQDHASKLRDQLDKLVPAATETFQKFVQDVILADKSIFPVVFPIKTVVDRYITQLRYHISAQLSSELGQQEDEHQRKRKAEEAKLQAEEMVMTNQPKTIRTIVDESVVNAVKRLKRTSTGSSDAPNRAPSRSAGPSLPRRRPTASSNRRRSHQRATDEHRPSNMHMDRNHRNSHAEDSTNSNSRPTGSRSSSKTPFRSDSFPASSRIPKNAQGGSRNQPIMNRSMTRLSLSSNADHGLTQNYGSTPQSQQFSRDQPPIATSNLASHRHGPPSFSTGPHRLNVVKRPRGSAPLSRRR